MLQMYEMVKNTYERTMYRDTCDIVEHQKVRRADKSTGFEDVVVQEAVPCRLSFTSGNTTGETESASPISQVIKVFLSPDIEVKAGSKLIINHLGKATEFKNTGVPSTYETHQEIMLELFKGWS